MRSFCSSSTAAVALLTVLALAGCRAGSQQCIILALGGNKLCRSDAAAWCRSRRLGPCSPSSSGGRPSEIEVRGCGEF